MSLSLSLFGPVRLRVDGFDVALGSTKQRALLALLALEVGRVVSTDRLIDELWPDAVPATASSTLQVYVSRLRRTLGEARAEASVVRRRPGYLLDLDQDCIDAHRAARLLEAARAELRDGSVAAAVRTAEEASELTVGDPLAGLDVHPARNASAEMARLTELALDVREVRAEALLLADRPAEAVQVATALIAAAPLRENAHVLLMRGLYRSGRPSEALAAYERIREQLVEELGTDPGPALRRVHARILQQDAGPEPTTQTVERRPSRNIDPIQLVGRDDVMAELRGLLRDARDRHGAVRVIDGEAGIGKTSIVTALSAAAVELGFATAWGRCDEAATDVPYWPWQRVLKSLPTLPLDGPVGVVLGAADLDLTPGPAAQLRLMTGLAEQLVAIDAPTLVIVEDIHWADDPSLALLAAVAERCADSPLVVLATNRVEAAGSRLVELFGRLARTAVARRIAIEGLTVDDVAVLLAARAPGAVADPVRLRERTEGNPFYITELVRAATVDGELDDARLAEAIPGTVRDVVTARAATLPISARRLLDATAVAAPVDDLELLARITDLDAAELDDALEHAVASGLLRERLNPRPTVAFAHSLIRETLTERLRPSVRVRLHAATAMALLAARPDDASDALVHHLLAGQALLDPVLVVVPVLAAAQRSMNAFALRAAEESLRRALAVVDSVPDEAQRTELEMTICTSLGVALAARLGWSTAEADGPLARAGRLALDAPAGPAMIGAFLYRTAQLLTAGRFGEVEQTMRALERRAAEHGEYAPLLGLMTLVGRGVMNYHVGRIEAAIADLTTVVDAGLGDVLETPAIVLRNLGLPARSFLGMALACVRGRGADALEVAQDAVRLSVDEPALDRASAHMYRSIVAATLDERAIARDDAARGKEFAAIAGAEMHSVYARVVHGWAVASAPGNLPPDDPDRIAGVREALDAHADHRRTGAHALDPVMWCLVAEAHAATGRSDEARHAARAGVAAAAALGTTLWRERLNALADA